ncbi:tRNA-splicing endonuclease subunit Sen2-like [Pectinophora gossypiella]|uniref:tRNA-splicing endonuclease subunit Sen2 n=1 Tax=Pectinophora gossypiella TaxID=13191 RepID=A0A1E1WDU7_PECGO|nr:tRNA-splicing endonuclease subunit Sen2-like [Pectinophora gossypiella]
MTTSQTGDDCHTNDPNNLFPIESLRFPLDNSMRIIFTGYYNGFSVEVRSVDEMALLYHMGCFGKGTASRSKPRAAQSDGSPSIIRKRQFLKRNYWYKKFADPRQTTEGGMFLKEVKELSNKIMHDSKALNRKGVIDLVSSDEDVSTGNEELSNEMGGFQPNEKDNIMVIVPNSDSEDDNYFAKLKPKCCLNRIKLQEKLMLTLQEAFFLLYGLGCLQIITSDNKLLNIQESWDTFVHSDKDFIPRYVVYHYFRSKGYVVKPGIKFGGDYLLYKEGPGVSHADYIVVIKLAYQNDDWLSILGHVRMANTTVKEILIAEVSRPDKPHKLPEDLKLYSVREILLNRKIPVSINNDVE